MQYKAVILFALLYLDFSFLSGQTIHYDYDDSGNRERRYIIPLKKATISGDISSKGSVENNNMEEFRENIGEITIKIYPNPTKGQLSVEIIGIKSDETVDYQLFSQSGQLLIINNKIGYRFTIDMERYSGGLYILRLFVNGKVSQWKVLKE